MCLVSNVLLDYCKFGYFREVFYFRETSHMLNFVKIKSLRNGQIILSFTGVILANFTPQKCLLTLFDDGRRV